MGAGAGAGDAADESAAGGDAFTDGRDASEAAASDDGMSPPGMLLLLWFDTRFFGAEGGGATGGGGGSAAHTPHKEAESLHHSRAEFGRGEQMFGAHFGEQMRPSTVSTGMPAAEAAARAAASVGDAGGAGAARGEGGGAEEGAEEGARARSADAKGISSAPRHKHSRTKRAPRGARRGAMVVR